MTDTANPRRWLRRSLITLLVLVVLASIGMSWVANRLERTAKQKEAVEAILATGARLRFDFEIDQSGNPLPEASPPGPAWLPLSLLLPGEWGGSISARNAEIGRNRRRG